MKFSIAMPVYNGEQFLEEALDALFHQSLTPDEIVVVDDGSTDDTPAILRKFGRMLRTIRILNSGAGIARKTAIEHCNNEWIALCDADDIWCSDHLERKFAILDNFPSVNVCGSNFLSFGSSLNKNVDRLGTAPEQWLDNFTKRKVDEFYEIKQPYRALLEFNPLYPSGLAFTRKLYNLIGGIDPHYSRWQAEDADFTRRLVAADECDLLIDSRVTWRYRRHSGNLSTTRWKNALAKSKILGNHIQNGITPEIDREYTENISTKSLGEAFDLAFWDGYFSEAKELYIELSTSEKTTKRVIKSFLAGVMRKMKWLDIIGPT